MPYGENDNHPLTNGTYNWHEDFGDEPSVEERYPDDENPADYPPDDEDEGEYDAELAQDQILERQELEDFEQADEYFGGWDFGGEG